MKLYTPMYGFSLVTTLVAAVILLSAVLGWPTDARQTSARRRSDRQRHLGRGNSRGHHVCGLLRGFLALNRQLRAWPTSAPRALIAGGGTGAEPWNAREWSSTAILYYVHRIFVVGPGLEAGLRTLALEKRDSNWVVGWSRLAMVSIVLRHNLRGALPSPCLLCFSPRPRRWPASKPWWERVGRHLQRLLRSGGGAVRPVLGGLFGSFLGRAIPGSLMDKRWARATCSRAWLLSWPPWPWA